jgi:hypothetical protein
MVLVRLGVIIWMFGIIVLALSATSSYLYSSETQPARSRRWASRLRMALLWPVALLSASGRSRLRRG